MFLKLELGDRKGILAHKNLCHFFLKVGERKPWGHVNQTVCLKNG